MHPPVLVFCLLWSVDAIISSKSNTEWVFNDVLTFRSFYVEISTQSGEINAKLLKRQNTSVTTYQTSHERPFGDCRCVSGEWRLASLDETRHLIKKSSMEQTSVDLSFKGSMTDLFPWFAFSWFLPLSFFFVCLLNWIQSFNEWVL